MAWKPISGLALQYHVSGSPAADYYLKLYRAGTTTPLSMATDDTGSTTLSMCQLNAQGYTINGSSDVFVPYVNQKYKAVLYTDLSDANADAIGSAAWVNDNLSTELKNTSSYELGSETATTSHTGAVAGHVIKTNYHDSSRTEGSGGEFFYTGAVDATKSGDWPNADGYFYDADGKRFAPFVVNVLTYGAIGDDSTNDTNPIQYAINYAEAKGDTEVIFPKGVYRIARTKGTNDKWGIKVDQSNVTLRGISKAVLRRFNTDITAVADAYAILFIGVADNDGGSVTSNIAIKGLDFKGEDTQHSSGGSSLHDFRTAIEFKNTKDTLVDSCEFTDIDSHAIYYQPPYSYDEENAVRYNSTKNYSSVINKCRFIAQPHSTPGRAVLHAVEISGIDRCQVNSNYFEWCDDGVAGTGTYDDLSDVEGDTWTPTGFGQSVKRTGRYWTIADSLFYNSSEHGIYPEGMDVLVTGNSFHTDDTVNCTDTPMQIRSRNATITGNVVHNYGVCVNVSAPSFNVSITGNTFHSVSDAPGGTISIDGDGLTTYIDNREYLSTYYPVGQISINSNVVDMNESVQTGLNGVAFRIVSKGSSDSNFPEGDVTDINISGNTIRNFRHGIYLVGALARRVNVSGNSFSAKSFTTASFTGSTTLNTQSVIMVDSDSTTVLSEVAFTGNLVHGSTYLFATDDGSGTNVYLPSIVTGNKLDYIKNFKTSDMRVPANPLCLFQANRGSFFLDRTTWVGDGSLNNSLFDGTTDNTGLKYCISYDGTNVNFYTDDSGTHKQLDN